jgi:hypothetical protein
MLGGIYGGQGYGGYDGFVEPALGGDTLLTVSDALHGHTTDNPVLAVDILLAINDCSHAHIADNLALTQNYDLTVADASHAHTADSITSTQNHNLVVSDSLHSHAAEVLTLSYNATLTIQEAAHTHSVDAITIATLNTLTVSDSTHVHTADNIAIVLTKDFTYENKATLPTTDTPLANAFTSTDLTDTSSDNATYVTAQGDQTYSIFNFGYRHLNNTDNIQVAWNGKATLPATTAPVYLQIYNYTDSAWETQATETTTSAGTDFTLGFTINADNSEYYGTSNKVTCRVYQGVS